MLDCFDQDFVKMASGFLAIIVFAMVFFYLLDYLSQNAELQTVVASIFDSLTK